MAFLERRRFTFFDLRSDVDEGKISEAVGKARVNSCSTGYGSLVLGDSSGRIHLVNKAFEVKSFQAYNKCVTLVEQCKQLPYLATIGEDGIGVNPHLRIWHTEKVDKNKVPLCLRVTRIYIPNIVVIPTTICISDNMTIMVIGFDDGSILIHRGDIKKERACKQTLIKNELSSITGLALSAFGKTVTLYVATVNTIEMYDIAHKDKEKRTTLNPKEGCSMRCSVLVEDEKDHHFFVAQNKAIFCYTNGILGPCYAVDGEKLQLHWFRGYLVIISEENHSVSILGSLAPSVRNYMQKGSHVITVLDTKNNVTAYHSNVHDVQDVLTEWGSFYILSPQNKLSMVEEKDLHSKLALLFKKNLYDVAISVAKFQQYDSDGLMEIFRQYGDHLYSKGDHKGAIKQYIKTIGKLEPSYVIRKYLGSQQVENLTTYLQALHKEGVASGEHTTLLLNFYTKLNKPELLKEFIMTKDRDVDFDVEVAIDVCRHVSPEDALLLAEKHRKHDWYLNIQIEDLNQHKEALDYIAKLSFDDADYMIRKYGSSLLEHIPDETTKFLIRLCTDYKPSNEFLVDESMMNGYNHQQPQKANPEGFIHYFLDNSERLVEFLEKLTESGSTWNPQVYTTLLEHYLQVWLSQKDISAKLVYESKIMKLLESSEGNCDKLQALILCKTANFKKGLLYLYEQKKMYQSILKYYVQENDHTSILGCCRRFEHQEPRLWVQALWELKSYPRLKEEVLLEILNSIERGNLMSPMLVIETLSQSSNFEAGHLKKYLMKVLQHELSLKNEQEQRISTFAKEIVDIQNGIDELAGRPIKFQASRCSICKEQLEHPAVHFFCQHSFHQHCLQTYADNDNECPPCMQTNKQLIDALKSQEENKNLHEMFHSQLEHAEDGFSLVTDYLGRGVFTKLTNYGEVAMKADSLRTKIDPKPSSNLPTSYSSHYQTYIPKDEDNLGPMNPTVASFNSPEGALASLCTVSIWPVVVSTSYEISERVDGSRKPAEPPISTYGSYKTTHFASSSEPPLSERIASSVINKPAAGSNPFGDDDDDEGTSNPFADDDIGVNNPFGDDADDEYGESDDYDKNLNPFA